jgi:hypothetical protein
MVTRLPRFSLGHLDRSPACGVRQERNPTSTGLVGLLGANGIPYQEVEDCTIAYWLRGQRMKADKLIQEYWSQGQVIARPLVLQEFDALISALRQRLMASLEELDLSPSSLKRLEGRLRSYHVALQEEGKHLSDVDVVELVREIAAYLASVLLQHTDATWRGGRSLWDSGVEVIGTIKVREGSESFTSRKLVYAVGNQAAAAWDAITEGQNTLLYSVFLSMKRKSVSQRLSK